MFPTSKAMGDRTPQFVLPVSFTDAKVLELQQDHAPDYYWYYDVLPKEYTANQWKKVAKKLNLPPVMLDKDIKRVKIMPKHYGYDEIGMGGESETVLPVVWKPTEVRDYYKFNQQTGKWEKKGDEK